MMLDVARAMANVFPNTEIPDIDTKQIHRNLTRREHRIVAVAAVDRGPRNNRRFKANEILA